MSKSKVTRNPVAKHMHKVNKPSVIACKRRSLQSEASLRDAEELKLREIPIPQSHYLL